MSEEKLESIAPGRLSVRLREGLKGHHPLFRAEEIRAAFTAPDVPMRREQATEVGQALLAMAREPLLSARDLIESLAPASRDALIRLYFRLLDRAAADRPSVH